MAEVSLKVKRFVRASETVQATAGEDRLVVRFPEAVPAGKVLNLRVEITGDIENVAAPAP